MSHVCVNELSSIGSGNGLARTCAKRLPVPMATYCQLNPREQTLEEIWTKIQNFSLMKMLLKMSSAKWQSRGGELNPFTVQAKDKSTLHCQYHAYQIPEDANDSLYIPCLFKQQLFKCLFVAYHHLSDSTYCGLVVPYAIRDFDQYYKSLTKYHKQLTKSRTNVKSADHVIIETQARACTPNRYHPPPLKTPERFRVRFSMGSTSTNKPTASIPCG